MRIYRVIIQTDKWPTEYTVNAGGWSGAVIAALQEFKQKFKGKQIGDEMKIKIMRSGKLLTAENEQ